MLRTLAVTLFLLGACAYAQENFLDQCEDLSCQDKETLLSTIVKLQQENRLYKYGIDENGVTRVQESRSVFTGKADTPGVCNICASNPCLNGGTCMANPIYPWTQYTCKCLDNFAGANCQKNIACTPTSCGANAQCYVSNHQTNCVCNLGYSGNPARGYGCTQKIQQACMQGDPHYTTFDGLHFDYMGTCPYVFSQPCGNLTAPYVNYAVRAKNELLSSTSHVSAVRETEVAMYDQIIHIVGPKAQVYVNGYRVNVPWYYPSINFKKISVTYSGGTFTVKNDQLVTVKFTTGGQLCVQVPDIPAFQGPKTLCGLAGNLDNNYKDDIVYRNGSQFPVDSRNMPSYKTDNTAYNHALDDWITSTFLPLPSNSAQCITGEILGNLTRCQNPQAAADSCSPIAQAITGQGVFAKCMGLGNDSLTQSDTDCIYDLCVDPQLFCPVMQMFARNCMYYLPNTDLGNWRQTLGCQIVCPLNSHYEPCTSSCPATCGDSSAPDFCDQGCTEGCQCDDGYVLDTTTLSAVTCVQIEECGCLDPTGSMHPAHQPWLSDNCQISAVCSNGTYSSQMNQCSPYAYCSVDNNYQMACVCLPGFTGDGYNCTDINECLDPATCNANKDQGTCTNTIGSYNCTCNTFFSGRDCQYYLPRRHCADIYTYWKETQTGVNWIQPNYPFNGKPAFTNVTVYCDMGTDQGGWTLMSGDNAAGMANKTFVQYVAGFGSPADQNVWLGLDIINGMTTADPTSLRVNLVRCPRNGLPQTSTYCTYPNFLVNSASTGYTVKIPKACLGTEQEYYDGWARWDLTGMGPPFVAYDTDKSIAQCSNTFRNTGFWFDTTFRCGSANLNGVRYSCDQQLSSSEEATYLYWSGSPMGQASLYLRPTNYPNYDPHPVPPSV